MTLVTGASGFVGQHLVRLLSEKGEQVRALYNSREPNAELKALPGIEWMHCNLLDIYAIEEAMNGVDEVYHCAAIVSYNRRDRERMLHFNIESTANIVNQALEQGIRKLVYVSSVAALGMGVNGAEITEEEQWEENKYSSVYGLSKHLAELEVWRGIGEGLDAVIVNPGLILGEGDWDQSSLQIIKLADKEFPFYSTGSAGVIDVKDVVNVMHRLMHSDVTAERFILVEASYKFKDIFTLMANALNRRPPFIKTSRLMNSLAWRVMSIRSFLFGKPATVTKETARIAHKIRSYNNSKVLGFLPGFRYTPVTATIERMAIAYRN
jgi:dihydroflavonol-4-reductase